MIDYDSLPKVKGIRLELFPAAVSTLPGMEVPTGDLKVVVTDQHMFVLANSASGPYVAFSGILEDYTRYDRTTNTWGVTLDDQTRIAISRADSCGCGSRLRGVRLFPAARRIT